MSKFKSFGTCLAVVVDTLCFQCRARVAVAWVWWVWSLVRKLGSHMLHSVAKKKKKKWIKKWKIYIHTYFLKLINKESRKSANSKSLGMGRDIHTKSFNSYSINCKECFYFICSYKCLFSPSWCVKNWELNKWFCQAKTINQSEMGF